MQAETLMDMPIEEKLPLQEIQNQQDNEENLLDNSQINNNNQDQQNIQSQNPLKEKNIYNQQVLQDKNSNSNQPNKYQMNDIENKENIYSQQQCISKKEYKESPLNEKDNIKSLSSVLKESAKCNKIPVMQASIQMKNNQTPSPKNDDKENSQQKKSPNQQTQKSQQQQNLQPLNFDISQNVEPVNIQKNSEENQNSSQSDKNQENLENQQNDQKTSQRPSIYEQQELEGQDNKESQEKEQNDTAIYEQEQQKLRQQQQQLEEEQKRKQQEYKKQQLQLQQLQEQRTQIQQQQQQQQQRAKKSSKFPEGTTITDLVTINQTNINYGIVIPGNILEETFEIQNKSSQGLVIKMTVICTNQELEDHDEYVYSVRKTVGYEYNEKFVVLIPANKSQTFKVALKVPNLQKECEIHGYASVQIQGVDDIYECPIKSYVQMPKIVCTKSLYSKSLKDQLIKVAIKRGKKSDAKIPLKSLYGGSLNLDFSWLQFQDQDSENQPYNLMIHPSQIQVQPNGTFMVNLLLKHNQNFKGDQQVYGKNYTLKKVLLAKIKNSTLILSFPIMMEIF